MVLLFAFVMAVTTGVVTGGLAGSFWLMVTGMEPGLRLITERSFATPIKVGIFVLNAPLMIVRHGWAALDDRPVVGLLALLLAGAWLFFQGIFVLTQVLGMS